MTAQGNAQQVFAAIAGVSKQCGRLSFPWPSRLEAVFKNMAVRLFFPSPAVLRLGNLRDE